jgi:hypothetical protein
MVRGELGIRVRFAYTVTHIQPTSRNDHPMTRTPTTSVTAIAIAARAFAWNIPGDAHFSGPRSSRGIEKPLAPHSLLH